LSVAAGLGVTDTVDRLIRISRTTRLGIPILYGVDAVHGHNNGRSALRVRLRAQLSGLN
jgi:hypothetical protein